MGWEKRHPGEPLEREALAKSHVGAKKHFSNSNETSMDSTRNPFSSENVQVGFDRRFAFSFCTERLSNYLACRISFPLLQAAVAQASVLSFSPCRLPS